jgi:hypothetical protein
MRGWNRGIRIHAKHCADCETKVACTDRVELALHFTGNITEQERIRTQLKAAKP